MNIKCILGFHNWDGMFCSRCRKYNRKMRENAFTPKYKSSFPGVRQKAIDEMSSSKQTIFQEIVKSDPASFVRLAALNKLFPSDMQTIDLIGQVAVSDNDDEVRYFAIDKLWAINSMFQQNSSADNSSIIMTMRNSTTIIFLDHLAEKFVKKNYKKDDLPKIKAYFEKLLSRIKENLPPSHLKKLNAALSEIS